MTGAIGGLVRFKAAGFLFKDSLWKCMITPAALALYNSLMKPGPVQYDPPVGLVCFLFSVAISASLRA